MYSILRTAARADELADLFSNTLYEGKYHPPTLGHHINKHVSSLIFDLNQRSIFGLSGCMVKLDVDHRCHISLPGYPGFNSRVKHERRDWAFGTGTQGTRG